MESGASSSRLFDPMLELLDQVVGALGKVGVVLPALVVQLFLLALVLAALYPVGRAIASRQQLPVTLPAAVALVLAVIGLVYGIVDQALLPSYVSGVVASATPADVRVQLLDYQSRIVTTGDGRVDSDTGAFALYYRPWLDGPARAILITGCRGTDPVRIELPRAHVRAGTGSQRRYACAG
jgi:hypothetical protein